MIGIGTNDVQAVVNDALKLTDTASAPVQMRIELSGGAAGLLNQLSAMLDRDRGEVIAEALCVLYLGVVVQKKGMNMAVVDQEGKVKDVFDLIAKNQ